MGDFSCPQDPFQNWRAAGLWQQPISIRHRLFLSSEMGKSNSSLPVMGARRTPRRRRTEAGCCTAAWESWISALTAGGLKPTLREMPTFGDFCSFLACTWVLSQLLDFCYVGLKALCMQHVYIQLCITSAGGLRGTTRSRCR